MRAHKARAALTALLVPPLLLAGCSDAGVTTQTVEPPPSSSASVPTASTISSPSAAPSTPATSSESTASAPTSADSSAGLPSQEAADRAAVEAQWIKSWDVYLEIARIPPADREALIATVAVDPAKANMLTDAGKFDSQGLQTYGTLGHRISWPKAIDGGSSAVIDDCQDASQSGAVQTATGDKITVGVARDHYQGSLVRGDDGVWRVQQIYYLKDEPC